MTLEQILSIIKMFRDVNSLLDAEDVEHAVNINSVRPFPFLRTSGPASPVSPSGRTSPGPYVPRYVVLYIVGGQRDRFERRIRLSRGGDFMLA